MKITDSKYISVLKYASEKHKGQARMNGNKYINHPYRVSRVLIEKGFDDNCVLAGLLHDVCEDCMVNKEEIYNFLQKILPENNALLVSEIVSLLTKDKGSTPEQTIEKIISCKDEEVRNRAIAVKYADIISNTRETIAHKNTKKNVKFKIKWIKKASRYLQVLEPALNIELQKGIKGNVYKKDIDDALSRLKESINEKENIAPNRKDAPPKRQFGEIVLNILKRYRRYIGREVKKGIA